MAKKTPEINSSSTADIAFLLLCYFLMTTTMGAMREVVELAGERNMHHLKFIVGGAVVDQVFADEIGAYYAADPMGALHHIQKMFN